MTRIDRTGRHHQTTREVIDFVLQCLQAGCSADEAIAALERDGVLLDAPLPTNKKEPIYSLCLRIVKTCKADAELAEYFATLNTAAQHTIDVIENRVPRAQART